MVRFGPAQAYRGMEQIHVALDVFEDYYDRLPSKKEVVLISHEEKGACLLLLCTKFDMMSLSEYVEREGNTQ